MRSSAAVSHEVYREILRTARRVARSAEDARDLVQDALEIALSSGFDDWTSPERRAWLRGVVRRRAAFLVRGQVRRRRREQLPDGTDHAWPSAGRGTWIWEPGFLASLPRSLRAVATLASADLCAAEIRWLLGLSDTALRQRLSALRRAVRAEAESPTRRATEPQLSLGGGRALLLASLRQQCIPALATHDPDGHAILLCVHPHKKRPPGNP
jgi:RNA polymerase sigma-70 factor (ECF subfamily)